jgi:hypothetical protein
MYVHGNLFNTQTVRLHTRPVWVDGFQVVSPLECTISTFLFVMDMRRVPFDLEFLYTASTPLGFGYGGTGLFGGSVLCHGWSTVCDPRLLW